MTDLHIPESANITAEWLDLQNACLLLCCQADGTLRVTSFSATEGNTQNLTLLAHGVFRAGSHIKDVSS